MSVRVDVMHLTLPANRRMIYDLADIGVPEVPLIGAYRGMRAESALPAHTHGNCLEIHLLKTGCQVFSLGRQLFTVRGGECFVTQPGEPHGTGTLPLRRGTVYWMQVALPSRSRAFCGLVGEDADVLLRGLRRLTARHFAVRPEAVSLFEELVVRLQSPAAPLRRPAIMTRLGLWLLTVVESAQTSAQLVPTADIRAALELMGRDAEAATTVETTAKRLGFSKVSFFRRFKEQTGLSPHDYLMDRRIERAALRLHESAQDITDLAYELGFSSSQYFSTVFSRYMGMSPSDYRRHKPEPVRSFDPRERVKLTG